MSNKWDDDVEAKRKYHREWMREKRIKDPEYKERQLALVRSRKAARRQLLASIKLERGCIDCGYKTESRFLQFDHRDPVEKSFTISSKLMRPLEIVMAEIDKCDVRCASCHEVRSALEGHNINRRYIEVADPT